MGWDAVPEANDRGLCFFQLFCLRNLPMKFSGYESNDCRIDDLIVIVTSPHGPELRQYSISDAASGLIPCTELFTFAITYHVACVGMGSHEMALSQTILRRRMLGCCR